MLEDDRAILQNRIEEYGRKIEDISAFHEDAMIDKIIRAFEKQIARDSFRLSLLE